MRNANLVGIALGLVLVSTAGAQTQVSAPPSGSTLIDFNSLSSGTLVTTQYAGMGVTISGGAYATSAYQSSFGGDPMQVANFNGNCSSGCQPLTFTFTFAQPITYFGFDVITNGTVTFNESNGSITIPAPYPGPSTFAGFTDANGFSWVTAFASDNDAFVFDNLSFSGATTVPEPSSMALLGAGIVGLVPILRRRRKHA
jgi:hypothetical protein